MQVGFGAAGAEIISQNLRSGHFDPMVKGMRITACYMFCDIRKFTDTTECLQEDVMVYVNRLGELVHTITVLYYGMANKNVGDAFLLSWKLCDGDLPGFSDFDSSTTEIDSMYAPCPPHAGGGAVKRQLTASEMADSALAATIKICNDLALANETGNLQEYHERPSIVSRFGENFRIRMGFGLHLGWCIEGAIGSLQKIDCTYLSPHVELSDRLEAGSKIFKTPINISHWFMRLLSVPARKFLRAVDRITAPGITSQRNGVPHMEPMTIFTFDITDNIENLLQPSFEYREGMKEQQAVMWGSENIQQQLRLLRTSLHPEFISTYNKGVEQYFSGNWDVAETHLRAALRLKEGDGPTEQLLQYMSSMDNSPPENWNTHYHYMENY